MTNDKDMIQRDAAMYCFDDDMTSVQARAAILAIPAVAASQPAEPAVNAGSRQWVTVKPLVELPVYVLVADDHDYDAGSQWVAGVFLTKEEAEEAQEIEDKKPGTHCSDIHEWTMIVDPSRILAAIDTQPDPRDAVIARLVEAAKAMRNAFIPFSDDEFRSVYALDAAIAAAKGGAA